MLRHPPLRHVKRAVGVGADGDVGQRVFAPAARAVGDARVALGVQADARRGGQYNSPRTES